MAPKEADLRKWSAPGIYQWAWACRYSALLLIGVLGAILDGADHDPTQLSQQAVELLQQGKAEEAIVQLKKIITASPDFFPAYSLLGVSYTQLGKLKDAQPYFLKAVELAPNSTQARNNLGANYLALGKPTEASEQFRRVVAGDPKNASAWVNLSQSELQLGQTAKALTALERAVALKPDDLGVQLVLAEAKFKSGQSSAALELVQRLGEHSAARDPRFLLTIGLLLERNGRGPEASKFLERARDADPKGPASLMALAQKSMDEEEYKTALALLSVIEESYSDTALWHAMVGYASYKLEKPEPALEHLQKAIHLDPANEDYYLDLAEFLGNNNALDAVVRVLGGAAKALPHSLKIQSGLAVAYLLIRDFEKTEAVLKKVLADKPDYEVGYKLLADCYNRAQDWHKLKATAGRLRELNEKNSIGWYYGAEAGYRLIRNEGGHESLESVRNYIQRALDINPTDWRSHLLQAKLLLEDKRNKEAVAALQKVIALHSEEPSAHYLLATTLRQLGKIDESQLAFKAFKEAQANEKSRQFRRLIIEIDEK